MVRNHQEVLVGGKGCRAHAEKLTKSGCVGTGCRAHGDRNQEWLLGARGAGLMAIETKSGCWQGVPGSCR